MRFLLLAGFAAMLAGCGNAFEQTTTVEALPEVVDRINREGTAVFAKDWPGVTLNARIDEGNVLVLMTGNVPTGTRTYDPDAMRKTLRPGICGSDNFREFLAEGGKVRVEMTSNYGKKLPPIQFAYC